MPQDQIIGSYCFLLLCLLIGLSVIDFNLGHKFCSIRCRHLIFGMHTPLVNTFQMPPRSITFTVTFTLNVFRVCCHWGHNLTPDLVVSRGICILQTHILCYDQRQSCNMQSYNNGSCILFTSTCISCSKERVVIYCKPYFIWKCFIFAIFARRWFIYYSNMTWFFSPIKSTDTSSALLANIKPRFPIQLVVTVFPENSRSENQFSCLFSGSLGWSWVIIRIEIKIKSGASLPSYLPRVINRSNLSPRRFAARW